MEIQRIPLVDGVIYFFNINNNFFNKMGNIFSENDYETVPYVDLVKYSGLWFEIARNENWFEQNDDTNVTAFYSLNPDGSIKIVNRCVRDGKIKETIGTARVTDATHSKLKVTFFFPFEADYQIVYLNEDYTYAIVASPSGYFWLLGRQKIITEDMFIILKNWCISHGYNKIIYTDDKNVRKLYDY